MATIIINRTNEFINRFRNYVIFIDNERIATIKNGETKDLIVPGGKHSVVIKIDWCSSATLSFDIKEEEIKTFSVGGFKNSYWLIPVSLILIIVSYFPHFHFLFFIIIPFFLWLLYYVSFGNKKYLTLIENK